LSQEPQLRASKYRLTPWFEAQVQEA